MKLESNRDCVFCGQKSVSKDHVPPKSFFPEPYPANLFTVPSCYQCNNGYSNDEDYVRIILSSAREDGNDSSAQKIWDQKVGRSLKRKQKIAWEILLSMKEFNDGRIAFKIDPIKMERVIKKIVKGLFFVHHGVPLDHSFIIAVHCWPELKEIPIIYPDEIRKGIVESPIYQIGNGVIRYRWITSNENINFSVWIMSFYNNDSLNFFVWTTNPPVSI